MLKLSYEKAENVKKGNPCLFQIYRVIALHYVITPPVLFCSSTAHYKVRNECRSKLIENLFGVPNPIRDGRKREGANSTVIGYDIFINSSSSSIEMRK